MATIKIHGYLIRSDGYNHLEFYDRFPKRIYGKYDNHWTYQEPSCVKVLPLEIMPELSWEDEPVEVDLEMPVTKKNNYENA
jgi:hypothetical protein